MTTAAIYDEDGLVWPKDHQDRVLDARKRKPSPVWMAPGRSQTQWTGETEYQEIRAMGRQGAKS